MILERKVDDSDINRLKAMIQKLGGVDVINNQKINNFNKKMNEKNNKNQTHMNSTSKNFGPASDLFVKIAGHKEIAKDILVIKEEMKIIANIISLLAKLEKIKENSIERLEKHLECLKEAYQDMFSRLSYLNQNMSSYYPFSQDEETIKSVNNENEIILGDLKAELEELKNMLDNL